MMSVGVFNCRLETSDKQRECIRLAAAIGFPLTNREVHADKDYDARWYVRHRTAIISSELLYLNPRSQSWVGTGAAHAFAIEVYRNSDMNPKSMCV